MENINLLFILKGKNPVPTKDVEEFGRSMMSPDRIVAKDKVDGIEVSTVFLGVDHNHHMEGTPILFETMVFGGELDEEQERYHTYDEAVEGHKVMVERVKGSMKK
jgi:FKBP-type peptidyl-prolyl cis-trans isomerase 2